jgi:hypothetical protein
MKARSWLTATVLAALLAPAHARAEGLEGRFTVAFQGGTESQLAGDFLKGTQGTLVGKPVTIESQRYRDIYGPDLRLQGLLGFGVGERTEIIARATWYESEGTPLQVGTLDGDPLYAFFEPNGAYEEVGFEVGLRFYISAAGRLKSYVAPVAGARFLSEVLVSFSIPDAGSSIQNIPFHEESTVAVFGLDLGFTFDLTERLFLGIDTGLRYQGAPSQFDDLEGLAGIDDSDGKWSAPVVASIGVRF